jgi:hypothetical protein
LTSPAISCCLQTVTPGSCQGCLLTTSPPTPLLTDCPLFSQHCVNPLIGICSLCSGKKAFFHYLYDLVSRGHVIS